MKTTRRQLRQIIKESFSGYADERPNNPMERAYARKEQSVDTDGNGIPDDQEDTMDPDDKVTMILNQIGKLLEDAYEIAGKAPDHQNKGEGYAMGEIVHSVDSWYSTYGSGGWQ